MILIYARFNRDVAQSQTAVSESNPPPTACLRTSPRKPPGRTACCLQSDARQPRGRHPELLTWWHHAVLGGHPLWKINQAHCRGLTRVNPVGAALGWNISHFCKRFVPLSCENLWPRCSSSLAVLFSHKKERDIWIPWLCLLLSSE